MVRSVWAVVLAIACGSAARALGAPPLELGAPFVDGAVLQRDMAVPVWGWTTPGGTVTVGFAGQSKTAKAGDDGKWMVALDPLAASFEAAEMKVSDDKGGSATVKDILVGEVWLASGQSNMQWPVKQCDGRVLLEQIAKRVAAGEEKQPVIREGKVTDRFAVLWPIEHAGYAWSTDASEFSAVSFAFAYSLFKELNVPIGILNCSFSQTSIQAWTPRVGFRDGESEYTKELYRKVLESDPTAPEHKAAWDAFYRGIDEAIARKQAISTKTPGNLNGNRDSTWLFNARTNPVAPYAMRGCIWNQGYANMGEGIVYYDNLHSMIRGWRLVWNRPDLPVYFHQFYTPGNAERADWVDAPSIGSTSEMRLGTWLARDIPNTGMACQIDIGGAIHYFNKSLPGMRLALHALKNQYGKKDVAVDGPMFKSCTVEGDKVVVEFDHADGGLVVAETLTNSKEGLAVPTLVPEGAAKLDIFYVADENRVWYPAKAVIDGVKVVVSSPKVKSPRGVSYGSAGIGFQPNLYNKAMLPMTPFIVYDHKLVTSKTWPDDPLKVDGVVVDPSTVGLMAEYRKLPILSTQFRDDAVLQAGQPVVIWGACRDPWTHAPPKGNAVIHFSFGGVEKTIPVIADMSEWKVTLPPMEASSTPKTLKVSMTIDGELAHEQVCEGIVVGDVWFVAASMTDIDVDAGEPDPNVRMLTRKAKRDSNPRPSRFSVSVSTAADNRFGSVWEPATGFAGALGKKIAAETGKPVGIVFMQVAGGKDAVNPPLAGWIKAEDLCLAPSLAADYDQLMGLVPGTPQYEAEGRRYVAAWKKYWGEYVPEIIRTKAVPDGRPWGEYPTFGSNVTTKAGENWNVMVESFAPGSFKGIVFLAGPGTVAADDGKAYGEQMTALANGWKKRFAGEDPLFIYAVPSKELAPEISSPTGIAGASKAIAVTAWPKADKKAARENADIALRLIEAITAAGDQ